MAINLLPEEEKTAKIDKGYYKSVIKISALTFLGVMFVFAAKFGINYYFLENLNQPLANANRALEPLKEYSDAYQKYINHEARKALANHVYFSKVNQRVEEAITPGITITSITYNIADSVSLQGYSETGIKAFSIFENAINKAGFTDLTVKSISVTDTSGRVDFSIEFKFNHGLITK